MLIALFFHRDHDLKVSLVQMPVQFKKAKTISAVVRTTSKINKILDLKGKKGCFPSIDGMGKIILLLLLMLLKKQSRFEPGVQYTPNRHRH